MDSLGKVTAQDLVDAVRPCLPLPHLDVVQIHGGAFWLRKKMDGDNWRNEALMIESGEQRIIGAIWQACAERGWAVFLDRIMNRSCVAGSDAPGTDAIALCRAYAAACEAGKEAT